MTCSINYAFKNRFKFSYKDSEMQFLNSSIISCNTPSISTKTINRNYSGKIYKFAGETITYDNFVITHRLLEDYSNWSYYVDWMKRNSITESISKDELYGGGTISLFDNKKNLTLSIYLENIFPYSLSSIDYEVADNKATYLTFSVTFAVNYMKQLEE